MDRDSIVDLIKEIGGPNATVEHRGAWVSTNCPLAPWTHETGSDSSPSFGIHVENDATSIFNCFTCKSRGTLPYLVELLEEFSGHSYGTLHKELENGELIGPELPDWNRRGRFKIRKRVEQLGPPVDKELLELYDPAIGHPYLQERGILDETAEDLQLLYDPDDGHRQERILFPVFAPNGDFYGLSGRAINNRVHPKVRDYFGLDKRLLLLGSHKVDKTVDKYSVLVEGLVDQSIVYQRDLAAMAAMHAGLTPAQARILLDIGLPVIVFFDNDKAGREGTEHVFEVLGGHLPILSVQYPKRKVLKKRRWVPVNDPGELYDDEIDSMVENAILL